MSVCFCKSNSVIPRPAKTSVTVKKDSPKKYSSIINYLEKSTPSYYCLLENDDYWEYVLLNK